MPIRLILQAVDQAWLLTDNEEHYARAGRGVVIYIAFVKDDGMNDHDMEVAIEKDNALETAVDVVLKTKIFTHFAPEKMCSRSQSLEENPLMDILVVPQASLGGKLKKGHTVQFHNLIQREQSEKLYKNFCHLLRRARNVDESEITFNGELLQSEANPPHEGWLKYNGRIICGTFGFRQGLRFESEGPFTHIIDIGFKNVQETEL